jgi:hypothetical protein
MPWAVVENSSGITWPKQGSFSRTRHALGVSDGYARKVFDVWQAHRRGPEILAEVWMDINGLPMNRPA